MEKRWESNAMNLASHMAKHYRNVMASFAMFLCTSIEESRTNHLFHKRKCLIDIFTMCITDDMI